MRKIFYLIFTLFIGFLAINNVSANSFKISANRTDYYRHYYDSYLPSGERYGHFSTFDIDGKVAYCIEPNVSTQDELDSYWKSTAPDHTLSTDTIRKLSLVAYYGYGYNGHNTLKYRMATQLLIWEISASDPNYSNRQFSFVNFYESDEKTILDVSNEYNEIKRLMENSMLYPAFNQTTINNARIGEEIAIVDTNGVLSGGYIPDNDTDCGNGNATCRIVDNTFYVTPNTTETISVGVKKEFNYYGSDSEIFYNNGEYQDLITAGYIRPIVDEIVIKSNGGSVEIHKSDIETNTSQGDATLAGAKYGIYDANDNLIVTLITDEFGDAKSDNILNYGNYYLKEISPSEGYLLDTKKYEFSINQNSNSIDIKLNVTEQVIKRDIELFKVFASNETGFLIGEPNITFDIYLKSTNEKVTSITTDSNGYATTTLPYGTYIVKQVNTTTGYDKLQDFEITIVDYSENPIYQLLANAPFKARLKVVKIDSETGNSIPLVGIKFKIYDLNKQEYVCQTTDKVECEFATNEEGILITPLALEPSNYRLEEVDQSIDGYLWNTEYLEFTIGDNSQVINDEIYGALLEVKFTNTQVKGQVEINKTGEDLVFKDNSYYYEKIPLAGVEFELRANEDIIISDKIYYHKDDLVAILTTNEFGYANIGVLPLGKYYLKEIKSSNNNVIDSNIYEFELTYKDQYTDIVYKVFNLSNKYEKGILEFIKTDFVTGESLPNTKIEIYTEDDMKIFEGYTDEEGKIVIENLPVGKYYLVEVDAPEGYTLNPERIYFEIKDNGEIVKANMSNDQIIDVPDTGISDSNILNVVGIIAIVLGLGYIAYDKFKKK